MMVGGEYGAWWDYGGWVVFCQGLLQCPTLPKHTLQYVLVLVLLLLVVLVLVLLLLVVPVLHGTIASIIRSTSIARGCTMS